MIQADLILLTAADANDSPCKWEGKEIFWLSRSEKHNVTWLSARTVTRVVEIQHLRHGKLTKGSEFSVTVAGRVTPSTFLVTQKRLNELKPKGQALAAIDGVLAGEFAGDREDYQKIRERIATAEAPVIF